MLLLSGETFTILTICSCGQKFIHNFFFANCSHINIDFHPQVTVGMLIEILFYLPNREKVKQVEMSEKASLILQAKDKELSAVKLVSIIILLRI